MTKPHKKAKPSSDHGAVEPVSLTCACNRDLTFAELKGIYPQTSKTIIEIFLPEINKACNHWGITTCLRKAHFLAQVSAETGDLTKMTEDISDAEDQRKYKGYKGRGLFQLTGESNYKTYGKAIGHNFLDEHRVEIEQPRWAADSGAWFWSNSSFNEYADKNDFIYIFQCINAGFNGWDTRKRALQRAAKFLLVDACPNQLICWDMDSFRFVNSALNNTINYNANVAAFAWGYWFDPNSPRTVVVDTTRNSTNAIQGYKKFLDLEAYDMSNPNPAKEQQKNKRGRFYFKKWTDMITHATEKLAELTKAEQ